MAKNEKKSTIQNDSAVSKVNLLLSSYHRADDLLLLLPTLTPRLSKDETKKTEAIRDPLEGSADVELFVGCVVLLHSLKGRPELNDRRGVVARPLNQTNGRVGVTVDGVDGPPLALKPGNLLLVSSVDAASEAPRRTKVEEKKEAMKKAARQKILAKQVARQQAAAEEQGATVAETAVNRSSDVTADKQPMKAESTGNPPDKPPSAGEAKATAMETKAGKNEKKKAKKERVSEEARIAKEAQTAQEAKYKAAEAARARLAAEEATLACEEQKAAEEAEAAARKQASRVAEKEELRHKDELVARKRASQEEAKRVAAVQQDRDRLGDIESENATLLQQLSLTQAACMQEEAKLSRDEAVTQETGLAIDQAKLTADKVTRSVNAVTREISTLHKETERLMEQERISLVNVRNLKKLVAEEEELVLMAKRDLLTAQQQAAAAATAAAASAAAEPPPPAATDSPPASPRSASAPKSRPRTPKRFRERSIERRSPTPAGTSRTSRLGNSYAASGAQPAGVRSRPPSSSPLPQQHQDSRSSPTQQASSPLVPGRQHPWVSSTDTSLTEAERAQARRVLQVRKEMAMNAARMAQEAFGGIDTPPPTAAVAKSPAQQEAWRQGPLLSPSSAATSPNDRTRREVPFAGGKPAGFAGWPSWKRKKWEWQQTEGPR